MSLSTRSNAEKLRTEIVPVWSYWNPYPQPKVPKMVRNFECYNVKGYLEWLYPSTMIETIVYDEDNEYFNEENSPKLERAKRKWCSNCCDYAFFETKQVIIQRTNGSLVETEFCDTCCKTVFDNLDNKEFNKVMNLKSTLHFDLKSYFKDYP